MRTSGDIDNELRALRVREQELARERALLRAAEAQRSHENIERFLKWVFCAHDNSTLYSCGLRSVWVCDACNHVIPERGE